MSDKKIHDEKGIVIPEEIKEVAFDFPRDINKIWALDLPVETVSISLLEWIFELPWFWQKDKPFSLKPSDVLNDPENYGWKIERIMKVDETYPIDIMFWKEKWLILDGLHRLCKLKLQGKTEIKVRKVPVELIEKIKPDNS